MSALFMKGLKKITCMVIILNLCSCSWRPVLSIRFYNEMPVPVNVSYMYLMGYGLDHSTRLHEMDTVCHKIDAGKKLKIRFSGYDTKTFASDSSYFEFIKIETPTKSVSYKGYDEMCNFHISAKLKRYNLCGVAHGKFIITDSLFNSAK